MAEIPVGAIPKYKLMTINPYYKAKRCLSFNFKERGEFGEICSIVPEQIIKCYSLIDKEFSQAELIECCSQCPYARDRTLSTQIRRKTTNRYPDFIYDLVDLEWDNPKSFLYFVRDGEYIKIGICKNISKRLSQLQVGNPRSLELICTFPLKSEEDALLLEKRLHAEYDDFRVSGEWFSLVNHISIQAFKNFGIYNGREGGNT